MSDTVLVVLIVAVAVVVVLYMFRDRLKNFVLRASQQGLETEFTTHQESGTPVCDQVAAGAPDRASVRVSGNVQMGREHKIEVERDDVEVSDNIQEGRGQEIRVKPDDN